MNIVAAKKYSVIANANSSHLVGIASQIFQSHVEYHMYAAKAGMVSIPKSLLVRLMNRLNEQEVDALSEHIAKNEIKDMTRLVKNQYSIPAFLDMFESCSESQDSHTGVMPQIMVVFKHS